MLRARVFPTLMVCYGLVAQSPTPTGPVRLSLQEAIKTSLENNLQVQIASEDREFTKASVLVSQGSFDWTLNGYAGLGRSKFNFENQFNAQTSTYETGDNTVSTRELSLGVVKPFE